MALTSRLEEIIRFVPRCQRVIDIGTDHALVPIALLSRDIVDYAVGIDKSPLPLGQATVNRHNAQVTDRLCLKCADGLDVDDLHDRDVIVMAGMGGRTMQEVLQNTSWRGTLILQPNRDVPYLRQWLVENGWYSDVESVLSDRRQYFWTSRWHRGVSSVDAIDVEFGVDTYTRSRAIFEEWFDKEHRRLSGLPEQAIDRLKIPLYKEMANRLSNRKNLG